MKLRLDEYYYILNENYGLEEIEDYMPEDIANKYLEFCKSHNSDEIDDYLKRLYSYIQVIDLEYTILYIDSEKGYTEYKAIIKVNNKYILLIIIKVHIGVLKTQQMKIQI